MLLDYLCTLEEVRQKYDPIYLFEAFCPTLPGPHEININGEAHLLVNNLKDTTKWGNW